MILQVVLVLILGERNLDLVQEGSSAQIQSGILNVIQQLSSTLCQIPSCSRQDLTKGERFVDELSIKASSLL